MRLIDADRLLDRCIFYHLPNGRVAVPVIDVQHAPTVEPSPRWIPVTERLPEEDDYRPCYGYEDGAVWWLNDMGLMGLGWYYPSTGKWAYYDESDRCDKCVGNVVAWMSLPDLPEPYREEGVHETD